MNPITTYLKNFFASKRILGDNQLLTSLVKADALLNNLITENKVPGISITVLKESKVLLQKGYGYADLKEKSIINPKKNLFRIASVSKNIAATALAKMVEEGIIDLDASFYEYVPYYPKKKWDFTLRQLASHTAGIRSYRGTEYGLNKPYSIKDGIEIFKDDDLLFEPGTEYQYTSYDWVLLSLAMQEASGIPFEEYVKQKVLNTLGMENTFAPFSIVSSRRVENPLVKDNMVSPPPDLTDRMVSFYTKNRLGGFRKAIPVNNYYKLAGGGYLSTSDDIAKFGQACLDGKVLTNGMQSEFLTSQIINGTSTYYGLGWQVSEDKKGRKYFGHIGNGVGGYSNFFVYPDHCLTIVILTNCTDPKIQNELDTLVNCLADVE